jgi:hypothetical protein
MSAPSTPNSARASSRKTSTLPASCFRSLVIYNPNLSQGKEERAMDNILFFYPPTVHPNQQMNHIGMCIAVMCFTERFHNKLTPSIQTDEIRTDHRCITVFSPAQDYYMALEADELYDSTIVTPLLRKAFAAFCVRHGVKLFCDPTRSDESQAVMKSFFTSFCRFMETSVMNMNIAADSGMRPSAGGTPRSNGGGGMSPRGTPVSASEYEPSSPTTSSALRTSRRFNDGGAVSDSISQRSSQGGVGSSPNAGNTTRRSRWEVEALSESLLHSPLRLQSTTTHQFQTCSSIVAQYLSMVTAQCPRSSNEFIANWHDDNNITLNNSFETTIATSGSVQPPLTSPSAPTEGTDVDSDGDERRHAAPGASSPSASPFAKIPALKFPAHPPACEGACTIDRCMWSGIRCLLLRREDRRLLMSTCGDFLASHLAYLSMIEPELTSFILKGEELPTELDGLSASHRAAASRSSADDVVRKDAVCCVHTVDDVMVFLLVEDSVHEELFAAVDMVASQLARELSEWLRCGTCTLLRQSAPSATSLLSMISAVSSVSGDRSPRRHKKGSLGVGISADRMLTLQQPQHFGAPSSSTMTAALREGASWVCWNNNVVHGAVLAHYPPLVQWTLGSLLREAIASATTASLRRRQEAVDSTSSATAQRSTPTTSTGILSPKIAVAARKEWLALMAAQSQHGKEFVECWIPLGSDGWLFVCQRNGRVVGVPYYSTSPGSGLTYLCECFAMADKVTQKLFHGAHFLAPSDM